MTILPRDERNIVKGNIIHKELLIKINIKRNSWIRFNYSREIKNKYLDKERINHLSSGFNRIHVYLLQLKINTKIIT